MKVSLSGFLALFLAAQVVASEPLPVKPTVPPCTTTSCSTCKSEDECTLMGLWKSRQAKSCETGCSSCGSKFSNGRCPRGCGIGANGECWQKFWNWLTYRPGPACLPVLTPTPYAAPLYTYFPCQPQQPIASPTGWCGTAPCPAVEGCPKGDCHAVRARPVLLARSPIRKESCTPKCQPTIACHATVTRRPLWDRLAFRVQPCTSCESCSASMGSIGQEIMPQKPFTNP